MNRTELKIGELAARAGVSVDALRYYERMKLLPRAPRTSGGFESLPTTTLSECSSSGRRSNWVSHSKK
jgi:hypothetical protein